MTRKVNIPASYELMQYLVTVAQQNEDGERLPSLNELSQELGVSVARLREQLEVVKAFGLVEVRPRTGIRTLHYSFLPAVRNSLWYAIEIDRSHFDAFSDLRNRVEAVYWYEAVEKLTLEDQMELKSLVASAWEKLRSPQITIPHEEHRELHLGIFRRLDNTFVHGILEAYWEAYEAVGLNLYAGYEYLEEVWTYHQRMVDAIKAGDYQAGFRALEEHKDLLYHRPVSSLIGNGHLPVKEIEAE